MKNLWLKKGLAFCMAAALAVGSFSGMPMAAEASESEMTKEIPNSYETAVEITEEAPVTVEMPASENDDRYYLKFTAGETGEYGITIEEDSIRAQIIYFEEPEGIPAETYLYTWSVRYLKEGERGVATLEAGTEYYIVLDSSTISAKSFQVEISRSYLSVDHNSSNSVKGVLGESAEMAVTAQTLEGRTISYQWQEQKVEENQTKLVEISGATEAVYRIPEVTADSSVLYYCKITDGEETKYLSFHMYISAGLTVISGNTWPDVWIGDEVTFEIDATSKAPIRYVWYVRGDEGWEVIENAVGPSYTYTVEADSPTEYRCEVRDGYDSKSVYCTARVHDSSEKRPVKVEIAPNQKTWHIYEHSGTYIGLTSYEYGKELKITYNDGTEEYIDSNYSWSDTIPKENGDWSPTAYGTYQLTYSYRSVSTAPQDIYVVRIGMNGSDLGYKETKTGQQSGVTAPFYQYYRFIPETDGYYQMNLKGVSGNGNLQLYEKGMKDELQTWEITGDEKLIYAMRADREYFLVVQGKEGTLDYDIEISDVNNELVLDQSGIIPEIGIYSYTPDKSGFYKLDAGRSFSVIYDENKKKIGKFPANGEGTYLHAGRKYIIEMNSYSAGGEYLLTRIRETAYPENIVTAGIEYENIWTFSDTGVLNYTGTGRITDDFKDSIDSEEVKELKAEEGITQVDRYTFTGCENLQKVSLPATVTTIGESAFYNCARLSEFTVAEGSKLETIGSSAFEGTAYFSNQTGEYVMIGDIIIGYNGNTASTVIPENGRILSDGAMRDSDKLEEIKILEKLKNIGEFSIAECDKLPEMDVPGNVTDIEYCAFYSDTALENVVLNEGVENIGEEAFFACTSLKSITIPASVKRIGNHAIGYAWAERGWEGQYYKNEELPTVFCYYNTAGYYYAKSNGLPYVLLDEKDLSNKDICHFSIWSSDMADIRVEIRFAEEELTEGKDFKVTYEEDEDKIKVIVTGIGEYYGTRIIPIGGSQNPDDTNPDDSTPDTGVVSIHSAEVKLSQTTISYDGSEKKPAITSVIINGKTLTEGKDYKISWENNTNIGTGKIIITGIGSYQGTKTITFVIQAKTGSVIYAGNFKYIVTGENEVSFAGLKNKKATSVKIPASVSLGGKVFNVTAIGNKALYKNTTVTQITVGNKVTAIGTSAFQGCSKLKKITLGTGLVTLGKNVMKSDKKLTSIILKSKKLKTIGAGAFKGISAKATIKVPSAKLKAYKKLLKGKGQSAKVKIKK